MKDDAPYDYPKTLCDFVQASETGTATGFWMSDDVNSNSSHSSFNDCPQA